MDSQPNPLFISQKRKELGKVIGKYKVKKLGKSIEIEFFDNGFI